MASDYAYQVMCRIEFTDGHAKPRWYTIGQYDQKAQATARARRFCRYLGDMQAQEPPRTKPHSLLANFEIRGPQGPWTECRNVVPKGVNLFAMMRNEKGEHTGTRAAPARRVAVKATTKGKTTRGTFAVQGFFVELEARRGAGTVKAYPVVASTTQRLAERYAKQALVSAVEMGAGPGVKLRTVVRSETGKLLARTKWVAA